VRALRRARSPRTIIRAALPHLVLAAAVALVVFPRATLWSFGNAKFAKDAATASSLPHYLMPPSHVIGWIFQTRELYSFVYGGTHGIGPALIGTVFPLLLLGVVLYGVVRKPAAGILLLFAVAAAGQAIYLNRSSGCTYCVNRSFMPIMPLVGVALFVGLREIARSPGPWRREVAGFAAGVFALAVGASVLSLEHRAERGSWMPSADVRTLASAVHHDVNATVAMEGWAQTPTFAWSENPTLYAAITEATKQRVSIVAAYSDFGGFGYLRTRPVGDPTYTPNYTYVVTRLNALDTGRPVVRRTRFATIEKRAGPFDAILARGVVVDNYLRDAGGVAHLMPEPVAGPLTFWVSALSPQRAFLRVWLSAPGLRPTARDAVSRNQRGQSYVCVPVAGTGSLRIVELHFPKAAGALVPFDMGPFDNDEPDVLAPLIQSGAAVNRVRVDTTPCGPGR
jgi:hypothetical protein